MISLILKDNNFNINSKLSPIIYDLSFPVNPSFPSSINAPVKLDLFEIISLRLFASGCCSVAFFTINPSLMVYVSTAHISSNVYSGGIFAFVPDDFMVLVLYSNCRFLVSIKPASLLNMLWNANGIEYFGLRYSVDVVCIFLLLISLIILVVLFVVLGYNILFNRSI